MSDHSQDAGRVPDLSLVMPCYNEAEIVAYTIDRLLDAFERAGHRLEIVAVDNGSVDRTGEILHRLAEERDGVVPYRVERNQGYGSGILAGIPLCTGRWAGTIPADGQVDGEDVVRLFEAAESSGGLVLAKVRRRFRMDGARRKIVSIAYNLFFRALWPRIQSLDINGSPKILPRAHLTRMDLRSTDWCLDPELMVKAHHMGLRVLELNVFARMRGGGTSHVRASTAWEFFRRLIGVRFFGRQGGWHPAGDPGSAGAATASGSAGGTAPDRDPAPTRDAATSGRTPAGDAAAPRGPRPTAGEGIAG